MPQSLAAVQLKWSRMLYAVAVVALLAIPVQYRGGADLPHAHALYQLWIPGGYGLVHHHPHVGERVLRTCYGLQEVKPSYARVPRP